MNVETQKCSPGLKYIWGHPDAIIFMDANFFIAPDRSKIGAKPISFTKYKEIWLEPLFQEFPNLAMHEAVYDELLLDHVKQYADQKCNEVPPQLQIYRDNMLDDKERALMQTYIRKISPYSLYLPERDNAKDRGEVKSLSYMAVKKFMYFAANDNLPIRLIEQANELDTGLQDMSVLKAYEVIYYLYRKGKYDNEALRALYKYQYYNTTQEKNSNPGWGEFVECMDILYQEYI